MVQRNRLFTSMPLGNRAGTEIRTRLRLRSTVRGANNRLDVDAIVSYDRGSNAAVPMLGALCLPTNSLHGIPLVGRATSSEHSQLCTSACASVLLLLTATQLRCVFAVLATRRKKERAKGLAMLLETALGDGRSDELGAGTAENAEGPGEEAGMPGRHYKRGLAPYVFVPWEHIQDSPLNLPIAKMDFYVPG